MRSSRSPDRDRDQERNGGNVRSGGNRRTESESGGGGKANGAAANAASKSGDKGIDREKICPMLLRVFCSTSRHSPMVEYNRGKVPANELQIYTWKDATLKELTGLIKEVNSDARRRGTYFDFAVVYPSLRPSAAHHYSSRDIGTTVSGQKGPDDSKTLAQCRFTVGDYIDVAITPPMSRGGGGRAGGGGGGGRGGPRRRMDGGGGPGGRFRPY